MIESPSPPVSLKGGQEGSFNKGIQKSSPPFGREDGRDFGEGISKSKAEIGGSGRIGERKK